MTALASADEARTCIALITDNNKGRPDLIELLDRICPLQVWPLRCTPAATRASRLMCAVVDLDLRSGLPKEAAQLLSTLRDQHRVPLIFVLDGAQEEGFEQSLNLAKANGARNYLTRPFEPDDINRVIPDAHSVGFELRASERGDAIGSGVAAAHRALSTVLGVSRSGRALTFDQITANEEPILEALRSGGIKSWLEMVRQHHSRTYAHSLMVTGFAVAFAQRLNMQVDDQKRIARACLLHDVGKAFTPLNILDKPGKLTPEEMDEVKKHPVRGYELLMEQGGFPSEILDCVRHHHELLDGSGYPDGLQDEQISDLVRITTIADIFSALVEKRSYKPALSQSRARQLMEQMEGKLDAHLLREFWPVASEVME